MSATRILLCFACLVVTINSCLIPDKKENQEIHVFHIGSPESKSSASEPDIIELHIPEGRRKRGASKDDIDSALVACSQDSDCPPGFKCSSRASNCQPPSSQLSKTLKNGDIGEGVYEYFLTNK